MLDGRECPARSSTSSSRLLASTSRWSAGWGSVRPQLATGMATTSPAPLKKQAWDAAAAAAVAAAVEALQKANIDSDVGMVCNGLASVTVCVCLRVRACVFVYICMCACVFACICVHVCACCVCVVHVVCVSVVWRGWGCCVV